jgi:MazG family protein
MPESTDSFADLSALVRRLRGPEGCPWDREQHLVDLRAYLLEEAHEVAGAIDAGDWAELRSELGDLLFQVVFIATLAEEQSAFDLQQVTRQIEAKMVARHPHVFGSQRLENATEVHRAWEKGKLSGKAPDASILGGVPESLPSLLAAYRMTQKAAGVGFDWPDAEAVLDKVEEEIEELHQEIGDPSPSPPSQEAVAEEIGDLLFTIANLARHLAVDPEAALARANRKFRRRFRAVEAELDEAGPGLAEATTDEMEAAWQRVKSREGSR